LQNHCWTFLTSIKKSDEFVINQTQKEDVSDGSEESGKQPAPISLRRSARKRTGEMDNDGAEPSAHKKRKVEQAEKVGHGCIPFFY